jgi:hypothetical protein
VVSPYCFDLRFPDDEELHLFMDFVAVCILLGELSKILFLKGQVQIQLLSGLL